MTPSPSRSRTLGVLVTMLGVTLPLMAGAAPFLEQNISRWGADYQRIALKEGGAEACAAACERDKACRAWSFVRPGAAGPIGECHLKASVPEGAADPCCISGVMAGASTGIVAATAGKDGGSAKASTPKPQASGVTGAAGSAKAAQEDVLEMPIESEPSQALGAIAAPLSLVPPKPASDGSPKSE